MAMSSVSVMTNALLLSRWKGAERAFRRQCPSPGRFSVTVDRDACRGQLPWVPPFANFRKISMVPSFRRYIGFFVAWAVGLVTLAAMPSQAVPQSFAATGVGQIPDSMICGSAGIPLALSFNVTGMGRR